MPCTHPKTLSLVVEGGNDYVVAVKANQGKLYHQIETLVRYRQPHQTASTPFECHYGRQEQRLVSVYSAQDLDRQRWQGAKTVLCVERRQCPTERCSIHRAYYLSLSRRPPDSVTPWCEGIGALKIACTGRKTWYSTKMTRMAVTPTPCSMPHYCVR